MGLTGLHVQPRLAVGDVSARQALILLECCARPLQPPHDVDPLGKNALAGGSLTSDGLRPPSVSLPPAPFSS
jgi:hypothetical protein